MPEGRTRGEVERDAADTRGVAQHPLLLTYLFTPSTLAVRRRQRRSPLCTHPPRVHPRHSSGITRG